MAVSTTSFLSTQKKFVRAEFTWATTTTTNQRPIFTLMLAPFLPTWSSRILRHDRIQKIQSKLIIVKFCCWRTFIVLAELVSNVSAVASGTVLFS